MAPKRKPTAATELPPPPPTAEKSKVATRSSTRLATRSSVASASARLVSLQDVSSRKKAKTAVKTVTKKEKAEVAKEAGDASSSVEDGGPSGGGGSKTIVVEHCKQCNSFKVRAIAVKEGLEKAIPGIKVVLNPEKPRRGCFEVREEGGKPYISLLELKRPFKPMKDLDMEEVIADIVKKINV